MRHHAVLFAVAFAMLCPAGALVAQRHSGGSSPPTAPRKAAPATAPIAAISSGLGPLQFISVNYGVPAPQSITRQLEADDERTRASSLSAIGAPAQYLTRGHIPYPHSIQLDFVALGTGDELDAILTVELDQHMVSAILVPEDGDWHRVATVVLPASFADPNTMPSRFMHAQRSLLEPTRYSAVYRGLSAAPNGDFLENEAILRVINGRAFIEISFVSSARACDTTKGHTGCEVTRRWLALDPNDDHHVVLVTGTGKFGSREAADPLARSDIFQTARLRTFVCQSFALSDNGERMEPTANPVACMTPVPVQH
jgi:hypothetical protein